jgi:hypothetical protein
MMKRGRGRRRRTGSTGSEERCQAVYSGGLDQ